MFTSKFKLVTLQYLVFCLLLDVGEEVYDDVDASDFPAPPAEMRSLKCFGYNEMLTWRLLSNTQLE